MAFADTHWIVSDPEFTNIPMSHLLSKEYAAERRSLINPHQATLDHKYGSPMSSSDTVYITVVDGVGTTSNPLAICFTGFGAGIIPKGWGFTLQNRGHNFSLSPDHPNVIAPRKRPYHTIIPGLITRDTNGRDKAIEGELFASFGVMGGFMQPQGHLQVASALIDDCADPQETLDRPRFIIQSGDTGGSIGLEYGIPENVLIQLSQMGHPIELIAGYSRAIFGRGQIILKDRENSTLWGG